MTWNVYVSRSSVPVGGAVVAEILQDGQQRLGAVRLVPVDPTLQPDRLGPLADGRDVQVAALLRGGDLGADLGERGDVDAETRGPLDPIQLGDEVVIGDDAGDVGVAVGRWEVRVGQGGRARGQRDGDSKGCCGSEDGSATAAIRRLRDNGHLRLPFEVDMPSETTRVPGIAPEWAFPRTCLERRDSSPSESRTRGPAARPGRANRPPLQRRRARATEICHPRSPGGSASGSRRSADHLVGRRDLGESAAGEVHRGAAGEFIGGEA